MIRVLMVLALAVATATAQSQNPATVPNLAVSASGQAAGASVKKSSVAGGQKIKDSRKAVITIQGLCSTSALKAAIARSCKTVITKAQFEALLNTINPSHQPIQQAQRQQVAQRYVELLAFAQAARKAGIEKDPKFQAAMRLQRMTVLQQVFMQSLEEKNIAKQQEIETYYKDNLSRFEEVKFHRIFFPKNSPSPQINKEEYEKKVTQVANDIRERAAKGEDPDKLQKEAYDALGITSSPMTTDLGKRKRGMFPPQEEQDVFALKPGEVTKVMDGPSGFAIYKVDAKDAIPLEQVKEEISRNLSTQKVKSRLDSVRASVHPDFNKEYFAPPAASGIPPNPHSAAPPPSAVPPTPRPGTAPSATPPATPPAGTTGVPPSTPTAPPPTPSSPPK